MAKTKTKSKKPYKRKTLQDRSTVLYIHGTKTTFAYAHKMGKTKFRGFSNYINWLIAKDMGDKKLEAKLAEIAKTFVKNKEAPVKKAVAKKAVKKAAAPAKARVKAIKPKLAAVPKAEPTSVAPEAAEPQQPEQVA